EEAEGVRVVPDKDGLVIRRKGQRGVSPAGGPEVVGHVAPVGIPQGERSAVIELGEGLAVRRKEARQAVGVVGALREIEAVSPLLAGFQVIFRAGGPGATQAGDFGVRRDATDAYRGVEPPAVPEVDGGMSCGQIPAPDPAAAGRYQVLAVG